MDLAGTYWHANLLAEVFSWRTEVDVMTLLQLLSFRKDSQLNSELANKASWLISMLWDPVSLPLPYLNYRWVMTLT